MEIKKEFIILVAQTVQGKSKFPHHKVGKFQRYKPWPYNNSSEPHRILYARTFIDTEKFALQKAEQTQEEMFSTYVLGMSNTSIVCVSEYTVVLHDITQNTSRQMSTTINDDESNNQAFLFPGIICSNYNLGRWGIIKGLH